MATKTDPAVELARDIGSYAFDPLGHAIYAYPWETERLPQSGPRTWQRETMIEIAEHLQSRNRFQPLRIARASGHGIGKSADIAMIGKWAIDTCVDTRVLITANTEPQLLTKTSPEVMKWNRLAITRDWFKPAAMKLSSAMPGHEDSWRLDLVTWSEHNTEAFAGLHNLGKRIVVLFDEASRIADKVWEVTEGALTDEDTELIWIVFGNPTLNTGRFRQCFGKDRNRWSAKQIDSRTVEGTNKEYLAGQIEAYGLKSDFVKVRVLGQFPSASSMQFIATDVAQAARTRAIPPGLVTDPIIFGVDCARFGDDHSTLAIRCGRDARTRPWKRWYGVDSMTLAGDIALEAQMWKPDAIFVDAGNIGAAVIDRLRQLLPGSPIFEVWFGGKGRDVEWSTGLRVRTANKRAEMYCSLRAWLPNGAIPDEQAIEDDLTGSEYGYNNEQAIQLEKKEHMKARGLPSPDDGDALACTFAAPVAPRVPAHRDPLSYIPQGGPVDRYAELRD